MTVNQSIEYARTNQHRSLQRLVELLRFPTISAVFPANQQVFEDCAAWLVNCLHNMGFQQAKAYPTGGPPVIFAEWKANSSTSTLLIYGHYDVMPVDPLEDWKHPPFEPFIDSKRIHARGASDDKGQFFALLCAAEAWIKNGGLPVNLKVILDGEEEESSRHLGDFIRSQIDVLRCDGIIVADMGGLDPMVPLVMYGTRGNCSMEVTVEGPSQDLHSGTYGGAVDNPLNVLTRLLGKIQDAQSRKVLVPGFYDRVKELTPAEQKLVEDVPITDEAALKITGAPTLAGEQGYPLKVRVSSRPTFEVHGIVGGYTGPGVKTVIPATVTAKLSFRLVPDQDPDEIFSQVEDFLVKLAPSTVRVRCIKLKNSLPATVDLNAPVVRAAGDAFLRGFGAPPRFVRGGGSLPILSIMQEHLHQNALLTGFGLPGDGEHAPNESLSLTQFYRGIEMMVHYLEILRSI